MFTVKDCVRLLREAKRIFITWNGSAKELDTENELEISAYGDFVVEKICKGFGENDFELLIKATPIKVEV